MDFCTSTPMVSPSSKLSFSPKSDRAEARATYRGAKVVSGNNLIDPRLVYFSPDPLIP
jgi:hypothetical protein